MLKNVPTGLKPTARARKAVLKIRKNSQLRFLPMTYNSFNLSLNLIDFTHMAEHIVLYSYKKKVAYSSLITLSPSV